MEAKALPQLQAKLNRPGPSVSYRGIPPQVARGQALRSVTRSQSQKQAQVEVAVSEADPSPYFEPLVRSLVLGVGAGVLCESAHVLFKAAHLAMEVGSQHVFQAISQNVDHFAPLVVWDNVAALGAWVLLYVIEAVAIGSTLSRHPGSSKEAARMIRTTATLPKKMLPGNINSLKKAIYRLLNMPKYAKPALAYGASSLQGPGAMRKAKASQNSGDVSSAATNFVGSTATIVERPAVVVPDVNTTPAGVAKIPGIASGVAPPKPKTFPDKDLKDPREAAIQRREKELLERKSYLKNFWYAAALSTAVEDQPVGVDILGTRVVLFRDDMGQVHCLDDACPHRGAPLSKGWVETKAGHSCVVCPYHGWAFDEDGRLQDVPSMTERGKWPHRPLVNAYPVEEKGGFIWLFYGSPDLPAEERPPIPYVPELDNPGWRAVYGELEFECGHWGVFENAIDMAHIHYLHNDSFGNSESPEIHDMKLSRGSFEVSSKFRIHNKPVSPLWEWTSVPSVPVEAKAILPSSSVVTIQLNQGVSMITFVNTVPINEHRAINRFCLIRNFALWDGFDGWARKNMYKILGEDKVMVEKLKPERMLHEYSLPPDGPQIAFRKLRQEFIDLGYGITPEEAARRRSLR